MLDVPMYFVYRDGKYVDCSGQSFRDFLKGKLPALPGEMPGIGDWIDHLTTAFPEVRLKRFLEMRGADGGPWQRLCALPALWVGLLYDAAALDAAWELCKDWTLAEREQLRADVPRAALRAQVRKRSVQDLAKDVLAIARAGLRAPRDPRREGPRREPLPRHPRRDRGQRPLPGGRQARSLQRPLAGQRRSGLHRIRLLRASRRRQSGVSMMRSRLNGTSSGGGASNSRA